uniref:Chemokine (C-C motif) ligand 34b, duplicate 3 n=1 Tax=Sinocyclocheilus anshuiensis TaxID=1608454 RepID=A0A671MY24_9TELE
MRSLAVVVIASVIWTITGKVLYTVFLPRSSVLADAEMVYSCCTRVSTAKVTEPIIGYKMQEKSLPCVKAVIFQTKQGDFCSDWRQPWVERKLKETNAILPPPTSFIRDQTRVGGSTQTTGSS